MWTAITIIALLILGSGIAYFDKTPDSPAEQTVEAILKANGVTIDFSPDDEAVDQPPPK